MSMDTTDLILKDIYGKQNLIKKGLLPAELIFSHEGFLHPCSGAIQKQKRHLTIYSANLARGPNGHMWVLDDRTQAPSGSGYALENRTVMTRVLPDIFRETQVHRLSGFFKSLQKGLIDIAPHNKEDPRIVILTPGPLNETYFEHAYLAQQMGITLAQGSDLVVVNDELMLRTTKGFEKVDVVYRRIDDDFLDPSVFRKDSMLGVKGIMNAYRKGNLALANAPGNGIADDKAVYAYVPEIIKYYLGEEPILPNVHTYICEDKKQRDYVLDNLEKLVVKAVNQSGGYGMLIGPKSTRSERESFAEKIKANPRDYIAQPTLSLSRCPTIIEGRHVDVRPYILYGKSIFVLPGGLTRVALVKGSLVVNSSQGGGSKDTWVLGSEGNS